MEDVGFLLRSEDMVGRFATGPYPLHIHKSKVIVAFAIITLPNVGFCILGGLCYTVVVIPVMNVMFCLVLSQRL